LFNEKINCIKQMIDLIEKEIEKIITEDVDLGISASERFGFGHYSSNVAFKLAKMREKSPLEVAKELVEKLDPTQPSHEASAGKKSDIFLKVEAAAPGFINFWLKPEIFQKELAVILKEKEDYGRNDNLKGQKTIVEYTDANPFKEFHIGHLMSNSIGEALARIMEWNGAKVKRACYQGDVGMHVAKAVWGWLLAEKNGFLPDHPFEEWTLQEKVGFLGQCYKKGAFHFDLGEAEAKEIAEINKKIYEGKDKVVMEAYRKGRQISLEYFELIYKKLGTKFDYYFFESETEKDGKKIVEANMSDGKDKKGKGIFEKSIGAVVFKGENYGLHTRVFINSEGIPTYEAKELGLAQIKYKKYSYDHSIIVTGNEVNDYFKVLLKVMEIIFPELAPKTKHLSHGMLRLPTGKMSSRTGDVITAEWLIGEVEKLVDKKMENQNFDEKTKHEIKEIVSVGAVKYSILRQAIGGDIIFDFAKSISFEGDSGPYLQYAYTRAKSVLEKAGSDKVKFSLKLVPSEISELEPVLCRFPEVVDRIGKEYAPHYLVTYLIELARVFNAYYAKVKIVDSADQYSPYKVALTSAFMQVMKNGLEILGIKVPERM